MILHEGLLVDLVPRDKTFQEHEHTWINNESSWWSSGGEWQIMSQRQVAQRFERRAEWHANHSTTSGVDFGVQTKDGTPIGFVNVGWLVAHHRLGMLGAKIGNPDYWGGGYGTDATLLLVDYAFNWLDLHKVWLMTTGFNVRVQRMMDRLGFVHEARLRESAFADGVWHDWLVYSYLQSEWPGRAALIERIGLHDRVAQP